MAPIVHLRLKKNPSCIHEICQTFNLYQDIEYSFDDETNRLLVVGTVEAVSSAMPMIESQFYCVFMQRYLINLLSLLCQVDMFHIRTSELYLPFPSVEPQ